MAGMAGLPGVGLGIYHSGLEMYGREVSFGYADGGLTGVFEVPAKCAGGVMPRTTFKESVLLGFMFRSPFEGQDPPSRGAMLLRRGGSGQLGLPSSAPCLLAPSLLAALRSCRNENNCGGILLTARESAGRQWTTSCSGLRPSTEATHIIWCGATAITSPASSPR